MAFSNSTRPSLTFRFLQYLQYMMAPVASFDSCPSRECLHTSVLLCPQAFLWLYHLTSTKQACILSGRKGEPFMHFLNPLILQISHSHCLCVCFGLGVICLLLLLLLLLCSCIFCSAKKTRFELESCVKLATIENSYLDMERTVGELTRRSKAR